MHNDKSINIQQTIYVNKNSHKPIILGKAGQNIKRIGNFSKGSGLNIYDKNHQNLNLVKKGFSHF